MHAIHAIFFSINVHKNSANDAAFMLGKITVSVSNTRSFPSHSSREIRQGQMPGFNGLKVSFVSSSLSLFFASLRKCIEFLFCWPNKFLLVHSLSNATFIVKRIVVRFNPPLFVFGLWAKKRKSSLICSRQISSQISFLFRDNSKCGRKFRKLLLLSQDGFSVEFHFSPNFLESSS